MAMIRWWGLPDGSREKIVTHIHTLLSPPYPSRTSRTQHLNTPQETLYSPTSLLNPLMSLLLPLLPSTTYCNPDLIPPHWQPQAESALLSILSPPLSLSLFLTLSPSFSPLRRVVLVSGRECSCE